MNNHLVYICSELLSQPPLAEKRQNDEYLFIFDMDYTLYFSKELLIADNKHLHDEFRIRLAEKKLDQEMSFETIRKLYIGNGYHAPFTKYLGVPVIEYAEKIDVMDFENYISKNQELCDLLESLKHDKVILTNAYKPRVEKILGILDLKGVDKVFLTDTKEDLNPLKKPDPIVFNIVDHCMGVKNKENVLFFDDSADAVEAAKNHGWTSFLVGENKIISLIKKAQVLIEERKSLREYKVTQIGEFTNTISLIKKSY